MITSIKPVKAFLYEARYDAINVEKDTPSIKEIPIEGNFQYNLYDFNSLHDLLRALVKALAKAMNIPTDAEWDADDLEKDFLSFYWGRNTDIPDIHNIFVLKFELEIIRE